jgi:chaperone required for assembly of F1-ATPase
VIDAPRVTADHIAGREPPPKIRRVYKTVSVGEDGGRYRLLLDGKPARTPLRLVLETPVRPLAEAIAAEWDAQSETIVVGTMPMTRLLATALDRIAPARAQVIAELMAHVHSDALCYRAERPADLRARQQAAWQPVLAWLERAHGIVLAVTAGVMPQEQTPDTVERMAAMIGGLDDHQLTAFQACAAATGSLALAAALVHGRLSAAEVFACAALDEIYQAETWGTDPLAVERRDGIEKDIAAAGNFRRLTATAAP